MDPVNLVMGTIVLVWAVVVAEVTGSSIASRLISGTLSVALMVMAINIFRITRSGQDKHKS